MGRKVAYWGSTAIIALMMTFAALTYLAGTQIAVEAFAHVGYPQHLRIILGIAKLAGVIVLLAPGLPLVKEWAYAGFTFAWIVATVAHYLAHDGAKIIAPPVLLCLLVVSYLTRSPSRRIGAATASA